MNLDTAAEITRPGVVDRLAAPLNPSDLARARRRGLAANGMCSCGIYVHRTCSTYCLKSGQRRPQEQVTPFEDLLPHEN